jgi:hypothetical protein
MSDTTETYVNIDKVTNALMTLAEKYQDRTQRMEKLALELCDCRWWEFSRRANAKRQILAEIDKVIKEDFIRKNFTDLLC